MDSDFRGSHLFAGRESGSCRFSACVFVVVLVSAVLISSGCGEGGSETQARPAFRTYSLALYSVDVPANWKLQIGDEPTNSRLESIWRERAHPRTRMLVTATVPAPRDPPISSARSERAAISEKPGYRELSLGPDLLAGRPAARWTYELSGERRIVYFLHQCEVAIAIRGSTPPASFDPLADAVHHAAQSVAVRCP